MNFYPSKLITILIMFVATIVNGQSDISLNEIKFRKGGDVVKMGSNCYQLTENQHWSSGAIWYPSPINLLENFEMEVDLFLGCNDAGADGIVFIFSPQLKVGYAGEGMGFAGLYPSLGIEFDTYQNFHLDDPFGDHIAVISNGSPNHRFDLAGPIELKKNLEDCQNHTLKVVWKAIEKELLVALDGESIIGLQKNIIKDIFYNNPKVYWGFSSATGGKRNQHKICFEKLFFEELPREYAFSSQKEKNILNGDITALDKVLFESGKAKLKKESDEELTKLVRLLNENPDHHISIYGHTDNVGNDEINKQLSEKRAESIIQYLVDNGINKKRLSAKGLGEQYPIASNANAVGRRKNRRVEIYMYRPVP